MALNADRGLAPGLGRPSRPAVVRRPWLRSVPTGASRAPRAPFVVLVLTLLGVGLIGLLLLNTALQQGSFALDELQSTTAQLRDEQTTLAEEVAERSSPESLARQASGMGMVPMEAPQFLRLPGGPIDGSAGAAAASRAASSAGEGVGR